MSMTIPLFLSDIAGSEILLILVFVLIFFGSNSIPGIAQTLGKTIRQIKDASQEMQDEIKKSTGDIKTDFNLQRMVDDTRRDIAKPFEEHARTLDQAMTFEPPRPFVKPTFEVPVTEEDGIFKDPETIVEAPKEDEVKKDASENKAG